MFRNVPYDEGGGPVYGESLPLPPVPVGPSGGSTHVHAGGGRVRPLRDGVVNSKRIIHYSFLKLSSQFLDCNFGSEILRIRLFLPV